MDLLSVDSLIVAGYFVAVLIASALLARRFAGQTDDFLTGGRTLSWRQSGLTMIAFAVDPAYMGMAGVAFLWGMYLQQWIAVHIWLTSWFAAMFLIPIYWRTRIVTTPEYLERRFNVQCRALFSALMTVVLMIILAAALYMGALLLSKLVGWPLRVSVGVVAAVCGFYVIVGGLRTVLVLDVYQAVILLITLAVVVWRIVSQVGGLAALAGLDGVGDAGRPLMSVVPPADFDPFTETMFPLPAILTWACVAGLAWIACNFGLVQRLLASRSEADAQKSLLFLAVLANVACFGVFAIGAAMRSLYPDTAADESFMQVMLGFPTGVRGLLAAGMMAALLSSADGLMTAAGTLLTQDVYLRFVQPQADQRHAKRATRLFEAGVLLASIAMVPLVARSRSAVMFVQEAFGNVLGVVIALYVVGVFSRRATGQAAFVSMVAAIVLAFALDALTALNFAYIGMASFLFAVIATLALSRLEAPPEPQRLTDLTVHTVADAPGPWVGLRAWPGLWKWALGLSAGWFAFSALWEWFVRSQ